MLATPEYSSSAQLVGVPGEVATVNEVEATDPPAVVDQISDLTAVPLSTNACRAQVEPLSVIELIEDEVFPSAQVATTVLPLALEYGMDKLVAAVLLPVFL